MSMIQVTIDGHSYAVDVQIDPRGESAATVTIDGVTEPITVSSRDGNSLAWALVGSRSYEVVLDRQLHWVRTARAIHRLELHDLETPSARPVSGDGRVKAPIPGTITRLLIEPGATVEAGQPLLVLEAMKMENQINAPRAGVVDRLAVAVGQRVALNTVLVEIV
ncbi:MAG: biotin/lipoyl-containing protein [Kouleothrix sp.]|jgi:biotin carboxyl carrier protein|nr:biotin/lipoyl-binding protein [Kouleothrix sp.]